ncbi:MAG: DUF4445 domain-containing protein, partial [Phycisphaerales bacterium]|nr:DUF4445 domain-containing protein [Phycisphaerales bacterium]
MSDDSLFPADATARSIARELYASVKDQPIVSPHGHTDPRWFAENQAFADPAQAAEARERLARGETYRADTLLATADGPQWVETEARVALDPATGKPGLLVTQRDIRELQFAKAAIATGWMLLLEEQGLTAADVAQVLLAGSFGSYLSPTSAVRIGLVPDVALLRIVSAGNVAGEGAKMALLSLRER